jgi:hypothetical protein
MRTIPTTVWNGKDMYTSREAEADYFHMYQTLIGDTSTATRAALASGLRRLKRCSSSVTCKNTALCGLVS